MVQTRVSTDIYISSCSIICYSRGGDGLLEIECSSVAKQNLRSDPRIFSWNTWIFI